MKGLRILSFNIHGGRSRDGKRDLERIRLLMDRLDIDIGVFQEMETRVSRGGAAADLGMISGTGRAHHLFGANMTEGAGWYGNIIVSRYPIARGLVHNLDTHRAFEPRNALDALIETPLGKLRIIGTHLSLALYIRYREAQNLIRLMQAVEEESKSPVLLLGDINEWQRPSRLLRFLDGIMKPVPCQATFPSFFPLLKLDRVWHDSAFKVVARRLIGPEINKLSDHLPVLVEVDLP
jgi:endonuclease/exonuclease/phosphatase family metal-dependent hydrolase